MSLDFFVISCLLAFMLGFVLGLAEGWHLSRKELRRMREREKTAKREGVRATPP